MSPDADDVPPAAPTGRTASERLESWKAIAAYLGRGVTTVQRWEQHEGLPVHRLPHAKKGSVFAFKSEIDEWLTERSRLGRALDDPETTGRRSRFTSLTWGWRSALAAVLVAVLLAAALPLARGFRNAGPSVASEPLMTSRPIASEPTTESCPTMAPGGTEVLYHWAHPSAPGLYIKSIAGGPPRRIVTQTAGALYGCGYAKWSPAGDHIAFLARGDEGTPDVWVIGPDGRAPRRLTSAAGVGLCWAPDGQSLGIVDRNSLGEPLSIFSISLRGGPRQRLTSAPAGTFGDTHCAYAPDGTRLAVSRYPNRSQSDLYVVHLSGSNRDSLQRLTTSFVGIEGLAWSPDGRYIVTGTHVGLWRVAASGAGRPARFAAFEGGARHPAFSRGPEPRLVYESDVRDVNIWRWDIESRQSALVAGSTQWEDHPALSPDGRQLVFVSNRTGHNELWVADADGSNPYQLTFHGGPVVTAPAWSPDGKWIAFSSEVAGNRDIYVIRPDGSQSTRVTTAPSEERNPSWSRDGGWLYFRSDQAGVGQLWKSRLNGSELQRVTSGEASEGIESPDGRSLYFVRNAQQPGLWSVPVAGGHETLIIPDVREGTWGVAPNGIIYLTPPTSPGSGAKHLAFYDLVAAGVTLLEAPPMLWRAVQPGVAVSRDGRFLLWTRVDHSATDLHLIDPWRP